MADVIAAAISNGSSQQLTAAVQKFSKGINKQTAFEAYPLHLAVWKNWASAVRQLLEAGAAADVRDGESGWTPLHKALYQGSLEVAALLLAHGCSIELLDGEGRLPLDLVSHDLKQQLRLAAASSAVLDARPALPHQVVVYSNLYSWGNGANFTLGTGSTDLHLIPTRVDLENSEAAPASSSGKGSSVSPPAGVSSAQVGRVVSLAAAKFHSALVTDDGRLFTFGFGRGGRLGHADFHIHSGSSAQILPRAVSGLGRRVVVAVAAAKHHTLVATSAGEVFSFGSNAHGRLGYPAVDSQPTPKKVAALPPRVRIVAVAAANKHSAAVTSSGELFTWGANSSGQLGYGTSDSSCNPTPRLVESLKGKMLVKVSAAKHHTVVLTSDGEVWTFGHKVVTPRKVLLAGSRDTARAAPLQHRQQPGASTTSAAARTSTASDINSSGTGAASTFSTAAVTPDASGSTAAAAAVPVGSDQLVFHQGTSDIARPVAVAISAGASHTSCLTRTGVVLVWPSTAVNPRALEVAGPLAGRRVVSLSAGKNRTAVVTDDGQVFMWESREGKKAKKKGTGDAQQQQQQQQGDKVTAAGAAASGGSKQQDVPKKLRPQPAAATDDQRDSQQCQQQAIKGAAVEQSNTAVTADDTATRAVASTVVNPSSSSSRVGMSGSTTSQAGATAAGSSTVAYGSGSSSSGGVVKSLLESWVGPTAPVAPERVHGPRHVTCVAVGEKHSLAVQSWTAPVLPDRAQQHHQMLDFAARHDGSSSSNRSLRQQQSSGQQAAAVDDMSASESSDLGDDVDGHNDAADGVAAAASISSAYTSIGHQSPARNSSSDGGCQVDISANERSTGTASGRSSSSSSRVCVGPEPLSVICERAVATQLVEPRTAPALLEYADMAGAALLRAYCLSVAVRNLDMLIAEARPAFEQLPRHLLAEMEEFYRQLALKEPPKTQRTAAAQHIAQQDSRTYDSGSGYQAMGESPQQQVTVPNAATAAPIRPTYDLGFHFVIPGGEVVEELEQQQEHQQQQVQQQGAAASKDSVVVSVLQKPHQYLYKRLHPGLRPTRYPDSGAGLAAGAMSAAAAGSAADHALLTAAAARGALAAVHRSWFDQDTTATHGSSAAGSTQQYLGSSSSSSSNFLSGDSGRLAALRAAGQKLDRNLLKKLQQIDVLESRQQQGLVLDSQQLAKLSLKGSILEALSQLRAGAVALDDIQGLLTRAQAVAHKLYLTPAPGAAADDDNDDRAISQQQAPPEQIALDGGSLDHSSSAVMTPPPAAAAAATAASASTSMSKKGSKQHKGDLSVFLTGELEKRAKSAAAAAADAAASSSKVLPKGPAWGGVSLQAAATSSLKDLLQRVSSTSAPPAVGSSTQASTTQQVAAQSTRPAALGTSRPTAAAAVAAASTATPEATKALVQEHTPSEAGTPVTPAAAKQAVSKTPGGLCSVEPSVSSSSSSKQQSALPPVGPSGHHQPSMTAVMQHQVGLTPHSASTSSTSPAASSSGLKLSLMDLVAHKRSSPLTVSKAKSVTTAAAGSSPPAAAAPAWGGVIGSSPPSSSKVSLRDIQLEQEQLRATTGWAAYQRERAAAAAAAGGGMAVGSPAAAKSAAAGPEAVAAVAPSKAFLQMKAAGGLSQALQTAAAAAAGSHKLSSATASPGVHSNSALLGSSPVASGSLSRSFKGGSSSSFTLHGSSPPAPSKWYIRDQPQVRSLTDIQDEEQVMQQQILFMKQIEEQKERERQEQKKKQKQRQRERREHRNNKRQAESSSSTKGVVDDDVVSGTGRESSASSSSRHNGEGERRRPRGASGTSGDLTADADGRAQHQQQQDLAGQQQQQPCQQHHRGQQPVRSAGEDGSGGQSQLARAHTQQQPGRFQQQHAAVGGRRQQQQQQRHRSQHPAVVPGDHQGRSLNQNAGGRQQHGGSRGRGHGRSGNSSGRGRGHREPPDADHPAAAAAAAAVGNKVGKGADAATVSGVSGTRNDETGGDSGWSVT